MGCGNRTTDPSLFCHHHRVARGGVTQSMVPPMTIPPAASSLDDPYMDEECDVMRNKVGARSAEELEDIERKRTSVRAVDIEINGLPGMWNFRHLKQFHASLFGDLYDWAGQVRTVDISKGDTRFAHHRHLDEAGTALLKQFSNDDEFWDTPDDETFLNRMTYYLSEMNALHPFREGNGRTQRAFLGRAAYQTGRQIDWSRTTERENREASIAAMRGDLAPMKQMLRGCLI